MDKIKELKEIIVGLKMDLTRVHVASGYCPYTYYKPSVGKNIDCNIGCERCKAEFIHDVEQSIREEVEKL